MATLKELLSGDSSSNQTGAISKLLTAKAGNLAGATGGGGAPRQENVLEQTVGSEVGVAKAQQAQQFGQQAAAQAQQQAQQQVQAGQAQQQLVSAESGKMQAAANQANEILSNLEANKDRLGFQERAGLEESAAQALRLSSEKYVAKLQDAATRSRIATMADAQAAMLSDQLEDMTANMRKKISANEMLQLDDQAFRRALANMSVADAKELAEHKMKIASEKQKMGAISGMITGGAAGASSILGKIG